MEWTEETIARLQDLWKQGLSTAEIGRQLGITKNAVVGKAHRLSLPPRPSPIRKQGAATAKAAPAPVQSAPVQPAPVEAAPVNVAPAPVAAAAPAPVAPAQPAPEPAPVVVSIAAHRQPEPARVEPAKPAAAAPEPVKAEPAAIERPKPAPRPALRTIPAEPRRRGPSCCWPLGDPGTPGFHFCGASPLSGKPYCSEHAAIAYVKLRDRRDSVA